VSPRRAVRLSGQSRATSWTAGPGERASGEKASLCVAIAEGCPRIACLAGGGPIPQLEGGT
jgi:hypothetical protein